MIFIHISSTVILLAIVINSEKQGIDGASEQSTPHGNIDTVRFQDRDGGSRGNFQSSRYRILSKHSPEGQPPQPLSRQPRQPRRPGHPRRPPPGSYEKYRDVVPKGRYISGSSSYKSDDWEDFSKLIYGADDFIRRRKRNFRRHSSRQNEDMPTICSNYDEVSVERMCFNGEYDHICRFALIWFSFRHSRYS